MKPAGVIGLCAAAASAHDTIQNHIPSSDFCRSSALLSQNTLPDLTDSTCSRSHDHYAAQYVNKNSSSPWTHVGPCYGQQEKKFCVYSSKTFAGGRGVSIVTRPARAEQLSTIAPFTNPDLTRHTNKDLDPEYEPVYRSVKVPGKGIGLVAVKTIERGDHIMSNTASVMIDYGLFEELKIDDVWALQAAAIDLLPQRHRALVMNLSTHVEMEMTHYQKVDRLLATNSFDIGDHDPDGDAFYVTFPETSRMNHDCRPNADYYYDPNTMTHNIHAVRRINIGEEITVSYIEYVAPFIADRK